MIKLNLSFLTSYVLCAVIILSCNNKPSKSNPQAEAVRFKTYSYIDKQGTGIEAFRMLIPVDWKFEGGINWILNNPSMPATTAFRMYKVSGVEEFEVFPNQPFFWTNNEMLISMFPIGTRYFGNEVHPPVEPLEALRKIVIPRFRQDVQELKIIREQPLPELAKSLGAGMQSQPGVSASADGAKISIEYKRNGISIEEEIYSVVEQISFPIQSMYGYVTNTIWFVDYIFSFKAEKGKLEANTKLFQTIAFSFKLNPLWFSKYNQVIEYLAQREIQQIRNIGQLSRIISQTHNEISDMMMESYNQRQIVTDRISENFSDYIRGVDRYYNPIEERPVELPSGYQNAWTNSLGEYIVSEDPNYNPNIGSNLNWQRMDKK
jgi:hypothetical protein